MKKILFYSILALMFMVNSSMALGPYIDNGDGTVTDKGTALMWQKADDGDTYTWKDALAYCESLTLGGYRDWRLPNIRELKSVVKRDSYNPAIDASVFECRSSYYWSSTACADNPDGARDIFFYDGTDYWGGKSFPRYVRCVRGGLIDNSGSSDIGSFEPLEEEELIITEEGSALDKLSLSPQQDKYGKISFQPENRVITLTDKAKQSVTIRPALLVPKSDIGKKAYLYMGILFQNQLFLAEKGLSGVMKWIVYNGGELPSMSYVTLSEEQVFDSKIDKIDFTDIHGTAYIYYGYATKSDLSDFVGTSFTLEFK